MTCVAAENGPSVTSSQRRVKYGLSLTMGEKRLVERAERRFAKTRYRGICRLGERDRKLPGERGLAFVAEIMLEGIGVLHPAEFHREAAFDLADDAALGAAERHRRADGDRDLGSDGGARERGVHDPAGDGDAGRQRQRRAGISEREALVA